MREGNQTFSLILYISLGPIAPLLTDAGDAARTGKYALVEVPQGVPLLVIRSAQARTSAVVGVKLVVCSR